MLEGNALANPHDLTLSRRIGDTHVPERPVRVRQTFVPGMDLSALEPCVERAWAISVAKAESCDRVVATFIGSVIAAWPLR